MRRRIAAYAAVAFALAVLVPAVILVPRAANITWVNTATQGTSLASATSLGALPGSTPLHVAVALRLRNQSGLDAYIKAINDPTNALFGQSLTPAQFAATYGPTSDSAQAVAQYLSGSGLTNVRIEPNNLFVSADGTAAQVLAAFNTSLGQFQQNGATVFANTTPAQVPFIHFPALRLDYRAFCCKTQPLPSGSLKVAKVPHGAD